MIDNTIKSIVYILDTETTGLSDPEPIEVVYTTLREFDKLKESAKLFFEDVNKHSKELYSDWFMPNENIKHFRFRPTKPIEAGASKVNNIYFKDVMHCPSSLDFVMPECDYIVAHHAIFDYRVISFKEIREAKAKNLTHTPNIKLICTKELAQLYFAANPAILAPKNNKLVTLIEYFYPKLTYLLKDAHSAKMDTLLCLLLFLKLVHLMPEITSYEAFSNLCSQGNKSYKELDSNNEKFIEFMPFGTHKGKN